MRPHTIAMALVFACAGAGTACNQPSTKEGAAAISTQSVMDAELTAFIGKIRVVDNHTHVNTVVPGDSGYPLVTSHLENPYSSGPLVNM
jgi:hypothetical protein